MRCNAILARHDPCRVCDAVAAGHGVRDSSVVSVHDDVWCHKGAAFVFSGDFMDITRHILCGWCAGDGWRILLIFGGGVVDVAFCFLGGVCVCGLRWGGLRADGAYVGTIDRLFITGGSSEVIVDDNRCNERLGSCGMAVGCDVGVVEAR